MRWLVVACSVLVGIGTGWADAEARSRQLGHSGGYSNPFSGNGSGSNPRSTYVNPYTRRDGTYVPGYHRTMPDGRRDNNYGTLGNYNPWTGTYGTRSDDQDD